MSLIVFNRSLKELAAEFNAGAHRDSRLHPDNLKLDLSGILFPGKLKLFPLRRAIPKQQAHSFDANLGLWMNKNHQLE